MWPERSLILPVMRAICTWALPVSPEALPCFLTISALLSFVIMSAIILTYKRRVNEREKNGGSPRRRPSALDEGAQDSDELIELDGLGHVPVEARLERGFPIRGAHAGRQ